MIVKLINHLKEKLNLDFYPSIIPKSAKMPCGVYNIIDENSQISINLGVFQVDYLIQIDIYTATYKEADLLKQKLNLALFSFQRPVIALNNKISFDDESYRLMCELKMFE